MTGRLFRHRNWVGDTFTAENWMESAVRVATWNVGRGLLGAKLDAVLQCMEDMHIEVLAVTEPGCTVGELRTALRARAPTGAFVAHGPKRASYVVFIVRCAVSLTVNTHHT